MSIYRFYSNIEAIDPEILEKIGDHYSKNYPVLCFNENKLEVKQSSSETRKTNTQAYIVLSPKELDLLKQESPFLHWLTLIIFIPITLVCLFISIEKTILLSPSILSILIILGVTHHFAKKEKRKLINSWDTIINNRIINYPK